VDFSRIGRLVTTEEFVKFWKFTDRVSRLGLMLIAGNDTLAEVCDLASALSFFFIIVAIITNTVEKLAASSSILFC